MITKKAKRDYVASKLHTDKTWACKGLLFIYSKQTHDEQNMGETKHDNGIGFSGAHAEIMSSFARQLIDRPLSILSEKQMAVVFKIMPKYWKQILKNSDQDKLVQCMLKDGIITAAEFVEAKL